MFERKALNIRSFDYELSVTNFINKILCDAIAKGASDIHFEPYAESYRLRFRIDGLLYENMKIQNTFGVRLNSCLKIMAKLDIAEKRRPQDGRFIFKTHSQKHYDCRLSVCPTMFGEKLVVRILNSINASLKIEDLELREEEQRLLLELLQITQGLILITGPTGSGKTLTLYTALNILNETTKNISTVEDPVEIYLHGINQVEINHKTGLDFATVLRAFLRQDPDIIMIGEIRDLETAEIAVKAALTGHLVLATLHTNSAVSSITRLLNMGVDKLNLAAALKLVIAQRLIRKLCVYCKQPKMFSAGVLSENNLNFLAASFEDKIMGDYQGGEAELSPLGKPGVHTPGAVKKLILPDNIVFYRSIGCDKCTCGYHKRSAVFEMLPITPVIAEMVIKQCSEFEFKQQLKKSNFTTLYESALCKVREGVTSLEEIHRVIG